MRAIIFALAMILSLNAYAKSEAECLAAAIWAEARGETFKGKIAVAHVILNRVAITEQDVCEVVHVKNQFSWTRSKADLQRAYAKSKEFLGLSEDLLMGQYDDPTKGATHFHTKAVRPKWIFGMQKTKIIGSHIFYKDEYVVDGRRK